MAITMKRSAITVTAAAMVWAVLGGLALAQEGDPNALPNAVRIVLHKAYTLMDEGKNLEAAALIREYEEKNKDSDVLKQAAYFVEFAKGNALYAGGKVPEAKACFMRSTAAEPEFQPAWLNLAIICHETKEEARAGECFAKAYEITGKKEPDLLYSSAVSYLSAGDYFKASGVFDALFAAHPDRVTVQWMEYAVHAHMGAPFPQKALALTESLVQITEGDKRRQWREQLLHQYMSLEMNIQALALARTLTEEDPGEPKWWKLTSHLQLSENKYKEGLAALKAAGVLAPWSREESVLAADLYLALDAPSEAVRILSGIPESEKTPQILEKTVYALRRVLEPEKALALLDQHAGRFKKDELLMLRADLLYETKQYQKACQAYETAAQGCASPGRAWLMAGCSALAGGDKSLAGKAFSQAAKYKAYAAEARDMIKRISL